MDYSKILDVESSCLEQKYGHLKNWLIFEKKPWTIAHGFFQKMAPKSPLIFITFSDTYQCPYAV